MPPQRVHRMVQYSQSAPPAITRTTARLALQSGQFEHADWEDGARTCVSSAVPRLAPWPVPWGGLVALKVRHRCGPFPALWRGRALNLWRQRGPRMTLQFAGRLAARRRLRRGTNDPAPEACEIALLALEAAIDQIPAHAFRHRQCKRRHQSPGGNVVVDIGPDAHGDAEPVDGGLQCLAVISELRSA